jgi:hypothetical protein
VAAALRADRHAQPGETAADHEHIGVDDVHFGPSFSQDGHQNGGGAWGGLCSHAGV